MEKSRVIGRLIEDARVKAGKSQDEFCRGLCSRTFLARVEKGERECERILLEALLQRAGIAADKFLFIVNPEEQVLLLCRERMYGAIEEGKEVENVFQEYRKLTEGKSSLHCQLLLLYQSVFGWKSGEERDRIKKRIQLAWEITREGFSMEDIGQLNLSMTEFSLALLHARLTEEMGKEEEAIIFYEAALKYLEHFADDKDVVRLYPQTAYRLTGLYKKRTELEKAVCLAQKCITRLRKAARLYYMRQFLEVILEHGKLPWKECEVLKACCHSLKWLYEKLEVEELTWYWDISFCMAEYEMCGDVLRARREALGMSQEELSEGICDPVSVSRIECGKVAPKRTTYEMLMKKIGLTGSRLEAYLQSDDLENWGLIMEIIRLLNQARGKEAERLIDLLEERIGDPDQYERQFLLHAKAIALGNQGKLTRKEEYDINFLAIQLTMPDLSRIEMKKWYFSREEIAILNALAGEESEVENIEKYIKVLYCIKRQYEEKLLDLHHYANGYELTCRTIGNVLGNIGRYEEAIVVEHEGMKVALQNGLESILCTTLYDCGWNMEHLWGKGEYTKEESLTYIRTSFFLELLYGEEQDSKFVKQHIRDIYGE